MTGTMPTASEQVPEGVPLTTRWDGWRSAPGLDTDLLALLQATAELELEDVAVTYRPGTGWPSGAVAPTPSSAARLGVPGARMSNRCASPPGAPGTGTRWLMGVRVSGGWYGSRRTGGGG